MLLLLLLDDLAFDVPQGGLQHLYAVVQDSAGLLLGFQSRPQLRRFRLRGGRVAVQVCGAGHVLAQGGHLGVEHLDFGLLRRQGGGEFVHAVRRLAAGAHSGRQLVTPRLCPLPHVPLRRQLNFELCRQVLSVPQVRLRLQRLFTPRARLLTFLVQRLPQLCDFSVGGGGGGLGGFSDFLQHADFFFRVVVGEASQLLQ